MFKKAKENKKGFTLAELLIVVAIIALVVRIIPQLNELTYCLYISQTHNKTFNGLKKCAL